MVLLLLLLHINLIQDLKALQDPEDPQVQKVLQALPGTQALQELLDNPEHPAHQAQWEPKALQDLMVRLDLKANPDLRAPMAQRATLVMLVLLGLQAPKALKVLQDNQAQ